MKLIYALCLLPYLMSIQGCQTLEKPHITESRQKLKDFGMAYCMRFNTLDERSKSYIEYANAESAYIQSGSHDLRIYKEFRKFIEGNYQENSFKGFEGDNTLFSCLTLYNSSQYESYVKKLDSKIYE